MRRLKAEYRGRVDVVSVNWRSPDARRLAREYVPIFTPTFVFVDPDGNPKNIMVGFVDESKLREHLELLVRSGQQD